MGRLSKHYGLWLTLFLAIGFVLFFYQNILINPNQYQFADWGDGIKNYFTYQGYIVNNQSNWNFEGLNYPYGESIFYTDSHPLLSFTLKQLNSVFPFIGQNSIGIVNFLMIFSLILTSLFTYLVMREFRIAQWYAAIVAFGLMVLAPQTNRFTGHLALSYSVCIPLTIYLLVKWASTKKNVYAILQCFNIFLWLTTHAYIGMVAGSLVIAFFIFTLVQNFFSLKRDIRFWTNFGVQVVLPLLLFTLLIKVTDTHTGRTDNPWGFFATRANFGSVFLPNDRPLLQVYHWIGTQPLQRWEGWAYVSILSAIIFWVLAIKLTFLFFIKKQRQYFQHLVDDKNLRILFLSGLLVLLFSMAVPFKYGLEFLLDWFPVFKQFRATGRFAWVFFFTLNITIAWFIYQKATTQTKVYWKIILVIFPILLVVEGFNQHKNMGENVIKSKNLFIKENLPDYFQSSLNQINPADFQAIISMPFYYIGGENYDSEGSNEAYFATELTAYHTGLPVLGSHLTRNSIWEAKNSLQALAPNWYKKEIEGHLTSKKDFLLVKSNTPLEPFEQTVINKAILLTEFEQMAYYRLPYDSLFNNNTLKIVNHFINDSASFSHLTNGFYTRNPEIPFIYNSFDSLKANQVLSGSGAYAGVRKNYNIIADFKGNKLAPNVPYVASFWIYNCGENYGQDILKLGVVLEVHDSLGNVSRINSVNPYASVNIHGCWSLIEMPFVMEYPERTYKLFIKGGKTPNDSVYVDEIFIYPQNEVYYKVLEQQGQTISTLFYNNHRLNLNNDIAKD